MLGLRDHALESTSKGLLMLRKRKAALALMLLAALALSAACSSSESQGAPGRVLGPGIESTIPPDLEIATPELPVDIDDPRCRDARNVQASQTATGGVQHVSLLSTPEPLGGVIPLSTATPRPGTVQFSAHLDVSGNSIDCFEVGDEASFSFGGTHDFGSDLLLRVTVDIPLNLQADSFDLFTSLNGADWVQDYPMPQPGGSSVSTGNTNFRLTSTVPGMYEVTLTSEWLDLESMNPVDAPNQSEVRTLSYYVLPN